MPDNISRRAAIGIGIAGVAAGVAGAEGIRVVHQKLSSPDIAPSAFKESEQSLLDNITRFRETLGLQGLPFELIEAIKTKEKRWGREPSEFIDVMPAQFKSYGTVAKAVTDLSFGPNAKRLVAGIRGDPQSDRWGHQAHC